MEKSDNKEGALLLYYFLSSRIPEKLQSLFEQLIFINCQSATNSLNLKTALKNDYENKTLFIETKYRTTTPLKRFLNKLDKNIEYKIVYNYKHFMLDSAIDISIVNFNEESHYKKAYESLNEKKSGKIVKTHPISLLQTLPSEENVPYDLSDLTEKHSKTIKRLDSIGFWKLIHESC